MNNSKKALVALLVTAGALSVPTLLAQQSTPVDWPTVLTPERPKPETPHYVRQGMGRGAGSKSGLFALVPAVIRVYEDSIPWFGENRHMATLISLGKVLGVDYFIHPLSDLATGIPAGTAVVLISSNGAGNPTATARQNDPAAQLNLANFVMAGGVLVVDMGDNDFGGGYMAPGAMGTPDLTFPTPSDDATLAPAALGQDGMLGTADDHPIVKGPDGMPGTGDDLNNVNIDMCCSVSHGNLADGITLFDATTLMTANFNGVDKPILSEYCFGAGRVIVDTVTKEFNGHQPPGNGPSFFLSGLLSYALGPDALCLVALEGRMTGGGRIDSNGMRVTHGFTLHCDPARGPNRLEVNWGGNRFHLGTLTSAFCSDDPDLDEGSPAAGFDTYRGEGTGEFNGVPGATAMWTFTDAGEPGSGDFAEITITDGGGNVVLSAAGFLRGNHQAHSD